MSLRKNCPPAASNFLDLGPFETTPAALETSFTFLSRKESYFRAKKRSPNALVSKKRERKEDREPDIRSMAPMVKHDVKRHSRRF
jgi:hypothetical protein